MDSRVLPYGFTVAGPILPMRVCKTAKTHNDYILSKKNCQQ